MQRIALFLRLFYWFSLRHAAKYRLRTFAVLCGIALGAAVFTSVRLSVHASLDSFSRSIDLISGAADRVLTLPGGRVPETLIPKLLKLPFVKTASPLLTAYVQVPGQDDAGSFLLIGMDPILDGPIRQWRMGNGGGPDRSMIWEDLLAHPFTLICSQNLAGRFQWEPGASATLAYAHRERKFHILDILAPQGLALAEGGRVAVTDIATFQEFTGTMGVVDRVDLLFVPPWGDKEVELLQRELPADIALNLPGEEKERGRGMIQAYQLNLSVLSFISLFVGMFLVYSLVALNAASRRRELAIFKAVGGAPEMVFRIFLFEGVLLGIMGWVVAVPMGAVLVNYLLDAISRSVSTLFVRVHVDDLVLDSWEIGLSFVLTLGTSVLGALHPAREAMAVPPGEAMEILPYRQQHSRGPTRWRWAALILILMVWPLSRLPGYRGVPLAGYMATIFLFVGFSILSPGLLRISASWLTPMLRRVAGFPAYLSGRYVQDSGSRTAVSVGALITAVALYTALVIMIHSFRQTVEVWTQQTVAGDLFVSARMAGINNYRDPLPEDLTRLLGDVAPEVDRVPYRRYFLYHDGRVPYYLEGIDMAEFQRYGRFIWVAGKPEVARPLLKQGGGVVVSEVFANRTGVGVGDVFSARVGPANVELPVLGIIRDYRTKGGIVFCDLSGLGLLTGDLRWSGVRFFFPKGTPELQQAVDKLRENILELGGDRVEMMSGGSLRTAILKVFDETFAVTTVLLFIALAVAALGITTTLTVLVLERSVEMNTLRAVGAEAGQIRTIILWESILMVLSGEFAGLACGFILSYLIIYSVNVQSFGWTFVYAVDWVALAISIPLIVATALAAAIPAVRLVLRGSPVMLLRER
jgi:putative ABC transport system permease protein